LDRFDVAWPPLLAARAPAADAAEEPLLWLRLSVLVVVLRSLVADHLAPLARPR